MIKHEYNYNVLGLYFIRKSAGESFFTFLLVESSEGNSRRHLRTTAGPMPVHRHRSSSHGQLPRLLSVEL